MFSGIISAKAKVKDFDRGALTLDLSKLSGEPVIGESIAVDGVCLTVISINKDEAKFNVMAETLSRTNISRFRRGTVVNIERALPADGRISGHFVQGHVDCQAKLIKKVKDKTAWLLHFELPREFFKYIVTKGSVAINGISLTVADTDKSKSTFSVGIIPHTWSETNLQYLKIGDKTNIEVDIIAKYLYHFIHNQK